MSGVLLCAACGFEINRSWHAPWCPKVVRGLVPRTKPETQVNERTEAQIVAEIATSLTDKPSPTAAEILMGISRAVKAGREFERESMEARNERYRQIVAEVLST